MYTLHSTDTLSQPGNHGCNKSLYESPFSPKGPYPFADQRSLSPGAQWISLEQTINVDAASIVGNDIDKAGLKLVDDVTQSLKHYRARKDHMNLTQLNSPIIS